MEKKQENRPFFLFHSLSLPYRESEIRKGLKGIIKDIGLEYVLRQNFFYPPHMEKKELLGLIKEVYKDNVPATSLVCQPVADGMDIGVEIWSIDSDVKYPFKNIATCDFFGGKWAFVGGIEPGLDFSFDKQADSVLNKMREALNEAGFQFRHLIRTWYYIGGILQREGESIRYDLLNGIRSRFYDMVWDKGRCEYPASTGIGMHGQGIVMDGIALIPDPGVRLIRLENPLQISAFDYDIPFDKRPRFCRAIFVGDGNLGITFVSGTASIRGSEVVYPGNIEKQTYVTIENIKRLINRDNLSRYGISWDVSLKDVRYIRIYLKKRSYYHKVKEICQRFFGDIPQLYLVADICRSSLLVEIEAVVIKGSA